MKRLLRPLALLAGLALLSPGAAPAQKKVAGSDDPARKLRGEYERLLAVERDPDTPPDVRAINRDFLEQRRAQLQALLKGKIESLRKYEADAGSFLSAEERLRVGQSIRGLEEELRALGGDVSETTPRSEPASARRASRRPARVSRSSTPAVVKASAAADGLGDGAARTSDASVEATPTPTPEPAGEEEEEGDKKPIVFVNPSEDKTVNVKEYQIEVNVPDQKIKGLMLSIFRPGATKAISRALPLERGDTGASQVVTLVKGANRIVVEDKATMSEADEAKKKKAQVTLTYEPPEDAPVGAAGGGGGGTILNATPTDKFTNVPEVGQNVRVGYVGEADKLYQFFVTKKDGTRQDAGSPTGRGLNGTVTAVFPELEESDRVGVVEIANGEPVPGTLDTIAVESPIDPTKGGPFGLMMGGVVMSQQAQQFGQSDPFFGFIAGYNFRVKNAYVEKKCGTQFYREMEDDTLADPRGFTVRCDSATNTLLYKRADNGEFIAKVDDVEFARSTSKLKKSGRFFANRMNLRFQGLFQADPRRAEATETATTDGGGAQTNEPFKFIASRKTFDVEMHGWIDFWANNMFTLGPYAAVGASTVLDKNELQGEPVTAQAQTGEGSSPDADTVATNAKSDNDIKKYFEFGFLSNTQFFNRKLFIQSILAYGNYEALDGLYPGHNTKHRFIGKLRIFPAGLSREFGRQIQAAPMFGVDLNAGRGPDHLKFFTGFAVRIRSINTN